MAFDLSKYETVDSRIHDFYAANPSGRINTEIEVIKDDFVVFKAYIYREHEDTLPAATGFCDGSRKSSGVDANFWLPNAETSAIGRALANLGISAKGARPSREEMVEVARIQNNQRSEAIANAPLAINNTWDEFVSEKPVQEVVPLDDAVKLVQQSFGDAEPIPTCSHGQREIKSGITNGKAWRGAYCSLPKSNPERCSEVIWYVLSKTTGKFRLPDGVE
jgi:hypothetical protein